MTGCIAWRVCLLCQKSPSSMYLIVAGRPSVCLSLPTQLTFRRLSGGNIDKNSGTPPGNLSPVSSSPTGLAKPLDYSSENSQLRRSADPNYELREYIEYSKVNSWHAAVGRKSPTMKSRWPYERLVVGVCMTIFLAYIYIRPENSTDEQFGMEEFGKGLFRPNPAMEHHIAATIQTVEARGGDASLYRNQLKILLKEKELKMEQERQEKAKADLKYDPKVHDIKY